MQKIYWIAQILGWRNVNLNKNHKGHIYPQKAINSLLHEHHRVHAFVYISSVKSINLQKPNKPFERTAEPDYIGC